MAKQRPGLDPDYQRLRDAREARRKEVERLAGFTDAPHHAWSRKAKKNAAIKRSQERN